MKVLITGRGTSGSFQIRGVQLGAAIGAYVEKECAKPKGYDIGVIVKRGPTDLIHRIRQAHVPIVWDVVDGWPQPHGNEWKRAECMGWLRARVDDLKPIAIVAATKVMEQDCQEFGLPVLYLPHHARPNQQRNPIREKVQAIGYEGGEQYLGHWRGVLENEAQKRGWRFLLNPPALADLDIVVALREAIGYAPRNWKSNVKLANAQGSGTPIICNREAGCLETVSSYGEVWADTNDELAQGLDWLTDLDVRKKISGQLHEPQLDEIADRYKAWLSQLKY